MIKYGIEAVLLANKTYKLTSKLAKTAVGKYGAAVVKDVKRKSIATYKTLKQSLLTGQNPTQKSGISSNLIYKTAPKGKMYKGKPQINIHASRKQSMIDTRKRELIATGGRFSKESKAVGRTAVYGSTGYYVGSGLFGGSSSEIANLQSSIQPSPNSNAKGSGVDMATSTPLVVENVGTLNQSVNVEAGANTDNKNAITSMNSVEMPSAVPIHGEQASNIVTPYFVGKDPRNQGYNSLQKQVMGRVDRSAMNRSKSLLRG